MKTLGLMSGTSADGIDVAFIDDEPLQLLVQDFVPYAPELKKRVLAVIQGQPLTAVKLAELDADLGVAYSDAVLQFLVNHDIDKERVSAIGLHGQTIAHLPDSTPPNTLQIGHPGWLAAKTNIPVIADFRTMDMAYGGQGAPLAPALHRQLFSQDGQLVGVLNLGGIANITFLKGDEVIGFDVGPANCLMDEWCAIHQNCDYDKDGDWAAQGVLDKTLLQSMLGDAYFQRSPPKSTGRELFNQQWLNTHLKNCAPVSSVDVQRTLLELVVQTVANGVRLLAADMSQLIVVGGGSHNQFLMRKLGQTLSCQVQSSAVLGTNPDYVEAMLMAWFAARHMQQKTTDMGKITGCRMPLVYGRCFSPGAES